MLGWLTSTSHHASPSPQPCPTTQHVSPALHEPNSPPVCNGDGMILPCAMSLKGYPESVLAMLILAITSTVLGSLAFASSLSLRTVTSTLHPKSDTSDMLTPFQWTQLSFLVSTVASVASMAYVHFEGASSGWFQFFVSCRNFLVLYGSLMYLDRSLKANISIGPIIHRLRTFIVKPLIATSFFAEMLSVGANFHQDAYTAGKGDKDQRTHHLPQHHMYRVIRDPVKRNGWDDSGVVNTSMDGDEEETNLEQMVESLRTAIVFMNILIWTTMSARFFYFKSLLVDWAMITVVTSIVFVVMMTHNWKSLELLAKAAITENQASKGYRNMDAG
ncbi:hypothetical protein BC829DRAFT_440798 [Chytridium lagenaria]|nr:hypothetical protein BC829DRAFT_440798 [Chytridium lagenaria]